MRTPSMTAPLTPIVKKLIIINVMIWFLFVVIFKSFGLVDMFSLVPYKVFLEWNVWRPFTYMFLHGSGIFHIVFNMLMLWWLGAELEMRWGGKFFLIYYLVCGVGAALIYTLGMVIYYLFTSNVVPLGVPVVGASGAVYGLMLAYGMIFGDRVMYFMMMIPMKAKYMIMILGGIEFMTLMSAGVNNQVANLAHLGGLITGFLFLVFWSDFKKRLKTGKKRGSKRGKLKLVVDNDDKSSSPKYWN